MDERDLSRLLRDAAASPSRDLDQGAIDRAVARRRRRRHTAVGAAAAALVLVAGFAAFSLLGDDESADVQFVDTPTTSTTELPDGDVVLATQLDDLEVWQLAGRYLMYGSDGISWLVDGHLEGVWSEPVSVAYSDGGGGIVFQDAVEEEGWVWDDRGAIWWLQAGRAEPVLIVPDGEWATLHGVFEVHGVRSIVLTRPSPENPEPESRHGGRNLTVTSLDSSTTRDVGWVGGGDIAMRSASPGSRGSGILIQVCHIRCAIYELEALQAYFDRPGDHQDVAVVDWGREGDPAATGLATSSERVATVRFEGYHDGGPPSVPELELLDFGGTSLKRLVLSGLHPSEVASGSASLDLAPDATSLILLPRWADEPQPRLVLGLDTDEPTIQRVLTDQALRFAPDAPTPGQGPLPIQVDAEEVDLADLEGRFLVFGSDGIAWLDGGAFERIWSQPVARAFPDGEGGVVFQELGASPFEMDGETGAIRWLAAGSPAAEDVVAAGERAELHQVLPLDGEPTVLYTRRSGDERSDSVTERLYALGLRTGTERDLGRTGGYDSYLDAVTLTDAGLVTSGCHLQCTVRRFIDDAWNDDVIIRMPSWISGLDGAGAMLAFVERDWHPSGVAFRNPALLVVGLDGEERRRARLPYDPDGSVWSQVDLRSDGRSALVVTPRNEAGESPRFDVVLLTGLDTSEPRVRIVRTDQALRFG